MIFVCSGVQGGVHGVRTVQLPLKKYFSFGEIMTTSPEDSEYCSESVVN